MGKGKGKPAIDPADIADLGTPERARHGGIVTQSREAGPDGGIIGKRGKVVCECRLDWYAARGLLADRLHAAGLRFRSLWEAAAKPARMTASYGEQRGGYGDLSNSDARADLRSVLVRSGLAVERRGELPAVKLTELDLMVSPKTPPIALTPEGRVVARVAGMDEWASGDLPALRDGLRLLADHWRIEDE